MCVIIHKPADIDFKEEDIRKAYDNNPHGFGYMYYDPKLEKIITNKTIDIEKDDIVKVFEKLKGFNTCFHYRWMTHGEVVNAQCHPFKILDKKRHGIDMFFMHNGVISKVDTKLKESDTQAFNRLILKPILRKNPSFIKTQAFLDLIENYIGAGSKLCFMFGDGEVIKVNGKAGFDYEDCWVSNKNSFTAGHRAAKNTRAATNTYGRGTGNNTTRPPHYSASQGTKTNVPATQTQGARATKRFLGHDVGIGSEVYLWHYTNTNFFALGKIVELQPTTIFVEFEDDNGIEQRLAFWLVDGNSYIQRGTHYYAVPAQEYESEHTLTVGEKKEQMTQALVGENKASLTTGGEAEKKGTQSSSQDETSNVVALTSANTKGRPTDASKVPPTPVYNFINVPVTYNNITVNSAARYGGDLVEDASMAYENFTYAEIDALSPEERFEFFLENQEVAFNMLQDLVEYIVIQDEESGLAESQENIDFATITKPGNARKA